MAYNFLDPKVGVLQGPTESGTDKLHPLGMQAAAYDSALGYARFVYVCGSNVSTAGALVCYPGFTAKAMSAGLSASRQPLGVAGAVLTATSHYGWVQVDGKATNCFGTNNAHAAGVPLFVNATAGQIATSTSLGNHIVGMYQYVSAASVKIVGSSLSVQMHNPQILGLVASI
jgi:hypothetical protein